MVASHAKTDNKVNLYSALSVIALPTGCSLEMIFDFTCSTHSSHTQVKHSSFCNNCFPRTSFKAIDKYIHVFSTLQLRCKTVVQTYRYHIVVGKYFQHCGEESSRYLLPLLLVSNLAAQTQTGRSPYLFFQPWSKLLIVIVTLCSVLCLMLLLAPQAAYSCVLFHF